jgi:gamma-glutamyltranspeptidase/glutathione hydrolase
MVHELKRGQTQVICGQGPAPAGATMAHYKGLGLDLVPGTGLLAPCIPGCFDAFMLLLRDYGTLRLEEVLAAAIGYARDGHPLLERASATIATVKDQFLDNWPTSAAVWLDRGNVPVPGAMFCNAVLADTYERVIRESLGAGGREAEIERARGVWSQGFVADAIDKFCRRQEVMDVSGRPHRGVLTGADMAAWSATVEAPIGYDYGRYRVQKPGPWCQGLVALQQLAILKRFELESLDPAGPDFIHWQVEAAKLAFADRDTFYGDPNFVAVPVEILLSDAYNDERQALISEKASLHQRPGAIPGYGKVLETRVGSDRTAVGARGAGEPTVGRLGESKGDTVHFDIVDRWGNMVSATPSGGWLQSSPCIPELGFCLGTRAQMFTMDEQRPACLAPGKRPRSTMS